MELLFPRIEVLTKAAADHHSQRGKASSPDLLPEAPGEILRFGHTGKDAGDAAFTEQRLAPIVPRGRWRPAEVDQQHSPRLEYPDGLIDGRSPGRDQVRT
jgi:hypothetical protein